MTQPIIGILGGMGPQASCELYHLINHYCINHYGATANADFPHLLISSLPVPDLIDSQESEAQTVALLKAEAKRLAEAGATDLIIACNTMHAYLDEISESIQARFHSLISVAANDCIMTGCKKPLILGTGLTARKRLYPQAFEQMGHSFAVANETLQQISTQAILETIAGSLSEETRAKLDAEIYSALLKDSEIDSLLLACTELPLVIPQPIYSLKRTSTLEAAAAFICELHFARLAKRLELDQAG